MTVEQINTTIALLNAQIAQADATLVTQTGMHDAAVTRLQAEITKLQTQLAALPQS